MKSVIKKFHWKCDGIPSLVLLLVPASVFFTACASRPESKRDYEVQLRVPTSVAVEKGSLARSAISPKGESSPVLSFSVEAHGLDMVLTSVRIDVGQDMWRFLRAFHSVSLVDADGRFVSETPVDDTSFRTEGDRLLLDFKGLKYMIPKDAKRWLSIQASPRYSFISNPDGASYVFEMCPEGVVCIDSQGKEVSGPGLPFKQVVTIISEKVKK